jgi:Dihydrouridine synthase (Dus)
MGSKTNKRNGDDLVAKKAKKTKKLNQSNVRNSDDDASLSLSVHIQVKETQSPPTDSDATALDCDIEFKTGKGLPSGGGRLPSFDYKYIVAPMVGASELPFRLLCRKYGAQLAYTPMMLADQFAKSEAYRTQEFQTTPFDRPLVCHFAANSPADFAAAARLAEPHCDAIDLNLGCPQRTAYVGHFGSYLLDPQDREFVPS